MTWVAFFCCLMVSFVFSGTEIGLLSLNRLRLRHLSRQSDSAALRLERLLQQPAQLFATVLVVTGLSNIIALLILTSRFVQAFGTAGYLWAVLAAFPVFLLVGEVLPKTIFRRFPYPALGSIAAVLEFTSKLLAPFNATASWFGKRVLHLSRPREIFLAREDLKDVSNQIERLGMLSPMERQMIHNVVSFRFVRVRDVMVPIEGIVSVPADSSLDEVIQRSRDLKFDRFPVKNQAGEIIGLINVLDVILDRRPEVRARQFVRRILSLGADDPAPTALRRLRASPQGLASVLDENRKVIGIVTLEDLLNPLVRVA